MLSIGGSCIAASTGLYAFVASLCADFRDNAGRGSCVRNTNFVGKSCPVLIAWPRGGRYTPPSRVNRDSTGRLGLTLEAGMRCRQYPAMFNTMTHTPHLQVRMRRILARLLVTQAVVTLVVAACFYIMAWVPSGGWSALYGGAVAMVVSALLAWRVARAARPGAGVAGLYLSTLERMAIVAAAFVLALAVLELAPLALIAGFIGAEIAYYLTAGSLWRQAGA